MDDKNNENTDKNCHGKMWPPNPVYTIHTYMVTLKNIF